VQTNNNKQPEQHYIDQQLCHLLHIQVEAIKERLLANNEQTYWVPAYVKEKRFHNWLEGAHDWAISRSRCAGVTVNPHAGVAVSSSQCSMFWRTLHVFPPRIAGDIAEHTVHHYARADSCTDHVAPSATLCRL
jgi:hypothetical protein